VRHTGERSHLYPIIRQTDLSALSDLESAAVALRRELSQMAIEGRPIEPGPLSFEAGQLISAAVRNHLDRFRILARLVDEADCRFLAEYPEIQKRLRSERAKLFRRELAAVAGDCRRSYRTRAGRLAARRNWAEYGRLLLETASTFYSVGKLGLAGVLFAVKLPTLDVAGNISQVFTYVSLEPLCAEPQS
jgi:hypothetical protein